MKRIVFLLVGALLPLGVQAAQADHIKASHAWIRLLPANLPAGGYVTLDNESASAATLVSAHSATYASAMLHQSTQDPSGNSTMRMVERVSIPAHGRLALAPSGYHLMLEQATHALKPGDMVAITLDFADGSHLPVSFLVRPANTSP
ncbi:copper chaperone PCu(A)C [Dyella monticola]|uniref:Copper chaperone PCu(A)C n=1 Tax=Dyella monticola TaxID=1927958 RepID=A0A370WYH6_9GAMM|nr:copper chaperone PCu(A)C [Dyella monticola]RDS81199.1 copper chaperone PCu(A)C [Dyella monticola]